VTPESPSFMDRVRAGMAALLARLATGARRLEDWSSRGMRPVLLGLAVMAVLVVGALAVVGGGREVLGWQGGGDRHERSGMRAKPEGKPELRHGGPAVGKPIGKPEGKPVGKPEGKPEAPRPPAPPALEAPAAPVAPVAP
jgi:hypothetical protein